jgi:hypothetical protein
MTPADVRVALPKLFLWSEAGRIQEYPEALSRAQAGRIYTRIEVERELFDIVPTMEFRSGAPRGRRTDGIVNTRGIERSGKRFRINGIDLFRKKGKGWIATEAGLRLGEAFRMDPRGKEWEFALTRQVLEREPRTRLIVALLLQDFTVDVAVAGTTPIGSLGIVSPEGHVVEIGWRDCAAFNQLLGEHSETALGPYWRADLTTLGGIGPICWEGMHGGDPSTDHLSTALKKVLGLFLHVGLLDGGGRCWRLNPERIHFVLGSEILNTFGPIRQVVPEVFTQDQAFFRALADTADPEGYVIVSRLADRFGELMGVAQPDRASALDAFARAAMYHDRLRVLERHAGQPRMGRGLFGENESRRVRMDFHFHDSTDLRSSEQETAQQIPSKESGEE